MDKRTFLKTMAITGFSTSVSGPTLDEWVRAFAGRSADELAPDEDFWAGVRAGYRLKPDYINLENGYYNFLPEAILEKYISHLREVNYQASYYMRTVQWDNKKKMADALAGMLGCAAGELIVTRNTTESLDMVIGGFNWKQGDEAVMAEQDYGAMLDMFRQVSERHGVIRKTVSVPNHPASDEEIVQLYAQAITPRTRLLMVCHMINITGQILPIRKICDMAHSKGVQVLVDGAHAVAHIRFNLSDLNCDYYGASLHKWLSVPLGAGILYVRKERIGEIWPLIAEGPRKMDDISRLNHTGTHPVATDLTIADAIDFYQTLGPERKEARLRYLQQYWTSRVRSLPHIMLNTPGNAARACGIANVGIKGMKPSVMAEALLKKYRIFTVAIDYAGVQGCRITPNIYTSTTELDALVEALKEMGTGS
jgi:selenocysteine lyase/cysteine desulfurase